MKFLKLIFVLLSAFLLIGTASALSWTSSNGCWTASDSYYNYVMWNTTTNSYWTVPDGITSVSYLVVAGGGSGGSLGYNNASGGGGGAGGFRNGSSISVSGYVHVIVGAGGSVEHNGADSTFGSITSSGGGHGGQGVTIVGYNNGEAGASGGSGGGQGFNIDSGAGGAGNTPATSPSQGNDGYGGNMYGWGGSGGGAGSAATHSGAGSGLYYIVGDTSLLLASGGTYGSTSTPVNGTGNGGGTNSAGSSGIVIVIYPKLPPTSTFTYTPNNGDNIINVSFSDTTNNPTVTSWSWKYYAYINNVYSSTVTFSSLQSPYYIFGTNGVNTEYRIEETTTNILGSNVSTQISWVNTTSVVANFGTNETNPNLINNALPIHFVDSSSNSPIAWLWNFGNGATSTSQNPVYTYTLPGIYNVSLKASDNYGGYNTTNQSIPVYIGTPYPSFTFPSESNIGNVVTFINTSYPGTSNGLEYNWSFGDSAGTAPFLVQTGSDIGNATHIYNYYGMFTPSLTITNANGTATYTSPTSITIVASNGSSSSGQGVTWFTPIPVTLQIINQYGNPASGATINCSFDRSTLSGGMNDLFNYYGMSAAAANSATNGALIMSGTADSTGSAVFTMVNALGYSISVTYQGTTFIYSIYPSTSSNSFMLRLSSTSMSDNLWDDIYSAGNTWTKATLTSDNNFVILMFSYQDTSIYTTRLDYYVYETDTIPNTLVYTTNVTSPAQNGIYQLNYTVPNVRGKNYNFFVNATRSI